MIGDPKQAVYKFRGADIFSYLEAQSRARHHFTLAKNWRSEPRLVAAVNELFRRERAFLLPELSFHPVEAGRSEADGLLLAEGAAQPPLQLWQLPAADSGHWSSGKAAEQIRAATVNEIVQLLSGDYRIRDGRGEFALKPADIAILVRTNTQAREYQNALRERSVPSVLNSTESVFTTAEAVDLYTLLQAVAQPGDPLC